MNVATALRIASSLIWAVTPEYLDIIMSIAAGETNPAAVSQQLGRPLQNARSVEVREGGIAVIPVHSVIFRRASMFDDLSGDAASVQTIAKDFYTALNDPAITNIVLDFDTPGGEVNGIAELAGHIFAARGIKPVYGYVGNMACSAGYWLLAACEHSVIHPTAQVGSIGVVAIADITKNPNKRKFVSEGAENKHVAADTPKGEALIQAEINTVHQMFVRDVAKFRAVSVETVAADFGKGGTLFGEDAITVQMVDKLGTFEGLIAELQQTDTPANQYGSNVAVDDAVVMALSGAMSAVMVNNSEENKENEDMTKEIVEKMLAGLSETEKAEVLANLGTAAPTAQAGAVAGNTVAQAAAAPVIDQAAAQQALVAQQAITQAAAAGGVDVNAALLAANTRAITAECETFVTSMATSGKITPVEAADVRKMYGTLAVMPDQAALNQYKASLQARATNPMLKETVAANGSLQVLGNGGTQPSVQEIAEDEAKTVAALLNSTPEGQAAAKALQAGEITPAYKQFAVIK